LYGWLTGLVAGMPLALGYALGRLLTDLHLRLFPSRRHAALANLATMHPGSTRRERLSIVRRMMCSYNWMLFEFFRLPHLDAPWRAGAA
jgi:lauroyl/myristoyl acyltransferase